MNDGLEDLVLTRTVNAQVIEKLVKRLGQRPTTDSFYLHSYWRLIVAGDPYPSRTLADQHNMDIRVVCNIIARIRSACLEIMPEECEYHPIWNRSKHASKEEGRSRCARLSTSRASGD